MPLGYNRVLGDSRKPAQTRPHRVCLSTWPTTIEDPRVETFEKLANFAATSGYEGVEMHPVTTTARYYPDESRAVAVAKMRRTLEKVGLTNFGCTLHVTDQAMRAISWIDPVIEQMKLVQDWGGEFASFQLWLAPEYIDTGGAYRDDERYLRWCADRVTQLRQAAWDIGLNFYLEVHIDRMTEDPAACCRLLDLVPCELNGDLSHLLYRAVTRGPHVDRILKHVGFTHVRMCRMHGDLSVVVTDPAADWAAEGVTWQMFQLTARALAGGLSSRAISGETGPLHLVKDSLTQDASLVPLYRAMARYADASAQGIAMRVESPEDLRPWG